MTKDALRAKTTKVTLSLSKIYGLLEPGPVVLLSTHFRGRDNVMTLSWQTPLEFDPPLIGCVVSNRDFSFKMLKGSKECVINVPTLDHANAVAGCGNWSGRTVDKFKTFGLTREGAARVKAPLIAECYASIECKVVDVSMVEKYNFFVLKGLKAWIDPRRKDPKTLHHCGNGIFRVASRTIRLPSKMK